jgi:hypothetical protein
MRERTANTPYPSRLWYTIGCIGHGGGVVFTPERLQTSVLPRRRLPLVHARRGQQLYGVVIRLHDHCISPMCLLAMTQAYTATDHHT